MDEISQLINDVMHQGELNLKEKLTPLMDSNSLDSEFCRSKFIDELNPDLQYFCRHAGEDMENYCADNHSEAELTRKINEKINDIVKQVKPIMSHAFINNYISEFEQRLNVWRNEQIIILQEKLQNLIPKSTYYSSFNKQRSIILENQGLQQAKEFAEEIVNIVYDARKEIWDKFHIEPVGGNIGNFLNLLDMRKPQMECSDWTEIFFNNLEQFIANYFIDNINSFRVEWIHKNGLISDSSNLLLDWGEHNLIRVKGPLGDIYIDPWKSGGKIIIGNAKDYENKKYKVKTINELQQYYPNKNLPNFFKGINLDKKKIPTRNRKSEILSK